MRLGNLAVGERTVNDAALEGVHRFEGHLSARAVRLFRKTVGERDERVTAFCTVILAVDDNLRRTVLFLIDIGAGQKLYRIEHFAAVTYRRAAVLPFYVEHDFSVPFFRLRTGRQTHCGEHSVDELRRRVGDRFFQGHPDFRPLEQPALCEHFHLNSVALRAEFRQRLFHGKVDAACFDNH